MNPVNQRRRIEGVGASGYVIFNDLYYLDLEVLFIGDG